MLKKKQNESQRITTRRRMTTNPKMTADEVRAASRKSGKAFCKVCFDAGKPETEYTSHYPRSAPGPDGKLVCPTLLNQSCLTCGRKGHTSSYCGKRKPMTTTKPITMRTKPPAPTTMAMPPPAKRAHYNPKSNAFGALTDDTNDTNDTNANSQPQTMAERLKKSLTPARQPMQPMQPMQPPSKKLLELPPRSQFWWQDED